MKRLATKITTLALAAALAVSLMTAVAHAEEAIVYNGYKSLEFQGAATALSYIGLTLEVGKTYRFTAWFYDPAARGARVSMSSFRWYGRDPSDYGQLETPPSMADLEGNLYEIDPVITDGTWQKAYCVFTVPPAEGDPMEDLNPRPGTSSYYGVGIDIRGITREIYIDEVSLVDLDNPLVNMLEDGSFENAVVGPNVNFAEGGGWPGANWVNNRWFPNYAWQLDGSGEISPFKIVSVDTEIVAPLDPDFAPPSAPEETAPAEELPTEAENPPPAATETPSVAEETAPAQVESSPKTGVSAATFVFAMFMLTGSGYVYKTSRKKNKTLI